MLKATVVGNVWATRRIDGLPSGALLEVEVDSGTRLVALDVLGTGIGEHVLVATGSVAASYFPTPHPPIDALVIGAIDDISGPRDTTALDDSPATDVPYASSATPMKEQI